MNTFHLSHFLFDFPPSGLLRWATYIYGSIYTAGLKTQKGRVGASSFVIVHIYISMQGQDVFFRLGSFIHTSPRKIRDILER